MSKKDHHLPPLNALPIFEATVRLGSITAAAKSLDMTQPAISRQILRLEQYFGTPLLTRLHRGIAPTDAGRILYQATHEGLQQIQRASHAILYRERPEVVSVATDFGFAGLWLLPRLGQFRDRYPNVDVRLTTSQQTYNLNYEPFDIAINIAEKGQLPNITTPLFAETVTPVCSPQFLSRYTDIHHCDDLLSLPKLGLEDQQTRWFSWKSWFSAAECDGKFTPEVVHFDNYSLLIQAAIAGQGLALGWKQLVTPLIDDGLLVEALGITLTSNRQYYLVTPNQRAISDAAWAFHRWVQQEIAVATLEVLLKSDA